MAFDGNGNYIPPTPPSFPAVAGTTITAANYNAVINDIATALSNCVTRDGQSPATADIPMGGKKHTNVAIATARTQYPRISELQDGAFLNLTSVGGTANAITAATNIAFTTYIAGQTFLLKPLSDNTGAVTLNLNGVGALAVGKSVGAAGAVSALVTGDLLSGVPAFIHYDGTRFLLLNPAGPLRNILQLDTFFPTTGTAPTYILTPNFAVKAYSTGMRFNISIHANNSGAASTLNVSGLGAKSLKQYNSTGTKVDVTLLANQIIDVQYDGTDFVVLDPLPPSGGFGAVAVITTTGASTWTIPTGVTKCKVTVVGGGGGGANGSVACGTTSFSGSGGGGGGVGISYLTGLTPGNTISVNVGAASTAGGTGNSTSISSGTQTITTVTATGGAAGASNVGGAGGSCSGAQLNLAGGAGSAGVWYGNPSSGWSGSGGNAAGFGGGAQGSTGAGIAATSYGGGGGGAARATGASTGFQGVVIFEY